MGQSSSDVFRARLVETRKALGYSNQAKLAKRLAEIGYPMHETAIARIESGARKVTIDDVVAIAAALDVALVSLLFPLDDDATVQLAPKLKVDVVKARRWARAGRDSCPLNEKNWRSYMYQAPSDTIVRLSIGREENDDG